MTRRGNYRQRVNDNRMVSSEDKANKRSMQALKDDVEEEEELPVDPFFSFESMESALGKQRMVMHKMVQGYHETAMKFISKKEDAWQRATLQITDLTSQVTSLQQCLKSLERDLSFSKEADSKSPSGPMSFTSKSTSRQGSRDSPTASGKMMTHLQAQLDAHRKMLAETQEANRHYQAENFELREQLAAMQAVGAAYNNINSRNLGNMQRVSTPLERAIFPPGSAQTLQRPAGTAPLISSTSTEGRPLTTGSSMTAFFEKLDNAQSEPLDRLERAQAKLDAWAGNHHPRPNPMLVGMMDFNTMDLPEIPGTEEWDDKDSADQTTKGGKQPAMLEDADEDESDDDSVEWSFAKQNVLRKKKKLKKKGTKMFDIKDKAKDVFKTSNVRDRYHNRFFGRLAKSAGFDYASILTISLNAVWIGVDTNYNDAEVLYNADALFIVGEQLFCLVFFLEIVVRFLAYKQTISAFLDRWFVFDFTLVVFMVLETWIIFLLTAFTSGSGKGWMFDSSILRILKLLRLTRVARIARLLRLFPEVMILLKGIGIASRSVLFTMAMLATVVYVFAIAFVQMAADTSLQPAYFSSLSNGMFALVFHGCFFDGLPDLARMCFKESIFFGLLLLLFLVVAPLTIMNMLVGVLVEVVGLVAAAEQDSTTVRSITDSLREVLVQLDENGDEMLSQDEFTKLLKMPEVIAVFNDADIDIVALARDPDIIFAGDPEMGFKDFYDEVLLLRGTNTATVKDVVQLRKQLFKEMRTGRKRVAGNGATAQINGTASRRMAWNTGR
eukprot:TRINITY_DN29412_c0_g3_i1.p1 TRINITY_DN29412_c0_g3~~TRINITY_DN29412_c0_g3_i1.p1  ORF type:complete len:781 (+),score=205.51 TRINITY_DN29412_c0_g3_i1:144-2486(+)